MGVDDNPSNTPAKQKPKIIKIKAQENEKSSLSPTASTDKTVGRSLRLRQRASAGNPSGATGAEAANSE